ncbi:MAG: LytTR family DNA-binding domain-containing protein [Lachnospiraceae bacterium]|nr:LytTR family DNA-binding domain-containing protein [Lachnospiraceae bacterium]
MVCVAVCDDEKYVLDKMKEMVTAFFTEKSIAVCVLLFSSGEELLQSNREIDVLFLDIQMKGMDGMKTAIKLRQQDYKGELIFITVLKEMVFQSFEVHPYDYLVKPIEECMLRKTMERLFSSMKNSREENLLVQRGNESSIISFHDIVYCEIINRKIYLHLKSGEVIDYYDKIESLEKKLNGKFFRCHRSYLINLSYLKNYKNEMAYLNNGKVIPVSRLRSREFSNVILRYMKERRR